MKLGVAVGPRRVGPGPDVPDAEAPARGGERVGGVARAVVGHHPAHGDPEALVAVHGGRQALDGALLPLVGEQAAAGDARGVVDADVGAFPAGPLAAAGPGAGDSVPGLGEAAELLDVEAIMSPGWSCS